MSSPRRLSIAFGIAFTIAALLLALLFALERGAGRVPAWEPAPPDIAEPVESAPVPEAAPAPARNAEPAPAPGQQKSPRAEPLPGHTRFVRRLAAGSRLR